MSLELIFVLFAFLVILVVNVVIATKEQKSRSKSRWSINKMKLMKAGVFYVKTTNPKYLEMSRNILK